MIPSQANATIALTPFYKQTCNSLFTAYTNPINSGAGYINSGVAEIVANRPGIGWWVWYPLNAGSRWTWPAGTAVSEIQVFSHGQTDPVQFDDVEIGILP